MIKIIIQKYSTMFLFAGVAINFIAMVLIANRSNTILSKAINSTRQKSEALNEIEIQMTKNLAATQSIKQEADSILSIILSQPQNFSLRNELLRKVETKIQDFQNLDGFTIPPLTLGKPGEYLNRDYDKDLLRALNTTKEVGPILRVYTKDNQLFGYTILHNRDGKPIAVLDSNKWTLLDNNFEYNNDETAFELISKTDRNGFFLLELKNNLVHIAGTLINNKGYGFVLRAKPEDGTAMLYPIEPTSPRDRMPGPVSIKPLFLYPHSQYPGKRSP